MAKRQKNNAHVAIKGLILDTLENIKSDIRRNMSAYERNASHKSERSLNSMVSYNNNGYVGTLSGSKSFQFMERGRKRGKVPRNFQDIIYKWMIDKGLSVQTNTKRGYKPESWEKAMKRAARAIAWNIHQEGTSLYYAGEQDIYKSSFETRSKELSQKASKLLSVIIKQAFTEE